MHVRPPEGAGHLPPLAPAAPLRGGAGAGPLTPLADDEAPLAAAGDARPRHSGANDCDAADDGVLHDLPIRGSEVRTGEDGHPGKSLHEDVHAVLPPGVADAARPEHPEVHLHDCPRAAPSGVVADVHLNHFA